jgi:hypothetical protein
MVGRRAGQDNGSGVGNVFLGYSAGETETGSNRLYIENSSSTSPLVYGEFDNDWLKINGNLSSSGGFTDDDNDTKIQVEESTDEDLIRFDVNGVETLILDSLGRMYNEFSSDRISIGRNTGTAGNSNTLVGVSAGSSLTSGASEIVAVGKSALFNHESGNSSIAIGNFALYQSTTGEKNTAVGRGAGYSTTGSGNVFLGYQAGFASDASNRLYIANDQGDPLIYGEFDNGLVEINGQTTTDSLQVGSGGSVLTGIIKASISHDVGDISPGSEVEVDFTVNGAEPGDVVHVSPRRTLPNLVVVAQARVSSTNNVRIRLANLDSNTRNPLTMMYDIVVIQ